MAQEADTTIIPDAKDKTIIHNGGSDRGYGYGYGLAQHLDTQWASEVARDLTRDIADVTTAVEKTGAGGVVATERVGASLSGQLREVSNLGRTDAISFANQARTDLIQMQGAMQLQAQTNAAAVALASAMLAKDLAAAKEALCCCIEADGEKTRNLLREARIRELEIENAVLTAKVKV